VCDQHAQHNGEDKKHKKDSDREDGLRAHLHDHAISSRVRNPTGDYV
jgi:hypothetical protein